MVGRFIGSGLLRRVAAGKLLGTAAATAACLCLVVSETKGGLAAGAALSIGLFNSIMFPTIFTLTLEHSSAPPASTSGLLCMAIIGGALLPVLFARVVDLSGIDTAFFVPLVAYALISVFGISVARTKVAGFVIREQ